MAEEQIGISYRINLGRLNTDVKSAKDKIDQFHRYIERTSRTVAAKSGQPITAMSIAFDKNNKMMLKMVKESFAGVRGAVPRMVKDFEKLSKAMGGDPARTGALRKEFIKVNDAIAKTSLAMDAAGKNGKRFYETANRAAIVQSKLRGELKATANGLEKVASAEQKVAAVVDKSTKVRTNAASSLREMGITSNTNTKAFQKMRLSTLEYQKVAKLTSTQMKRLQETTLKSAETAKVASSRYDRLSKRLAHSQAQIRRQTGAMGDSQRALERWSLSGIKAMALSQAAWIASGAVIFGTMAAIGQTVKAFMDFNQELTDAAAIVQATTTGYREMREAALSAFQASTMGAVETTQALKVLGQAGLDAGEAAQTLETIYKITTATGAETGEAVQFMTTALNVWKLSAKDAARVGNILGAALNYSKLEVEDIGTVFNFLASMAKMLGMSIEDLAATMAVMRNAGVRASTIATGMRGVFSKLIAPTAKFEKQLASVGLELKDVSLITNDFFTVLRRLETAGFDITKIFKGMRRREAAALAAALNQGTDAFEVMKKSITDTAALDVMFNRSMKGMKNQIILLGHSIQAGLIQGLEHAKPGIIRITRLLLAFVEAVKILAPALAIGAMAFVTLNAAMAAFGLISTNAFAGLYVFIATIHPAILAIGAVTAALTIGIRAWDAWGQTSKKTRDTLKQEIDDLSKLKALLNDDNRSREKKLEILADYAKDYPELLSYMDKEQLSMQKLVRIIDELNKKRKATLKIEREKRVEFLRGAISEAEGDRFTAAQGLPDIFSADPAKLRAYKSELLKLLVLLGRIGKKPAKQGMPASRPEDPTDLPAKEQKKLMEDLWKWELEKTKRHDDAIADGHESTEKALLEQRAGRVKEEKALVEGFRKWELETAKSYDDAIADGHEETEKELIEQKKDRVKLSEETTKKLIELVKEYRDTEFELLKQAKKNELDEADFTEWLAAAEFDREKERLRERVGLLEEYRKELILKAPEDPALKAQIDLLDLIIAKYKKLEPVRKKALQTDPKDMVGGIKKGFEEATKELANEYELWRNMTKETMMDMRDTMSDVFFDSMMGELKTAGDYWRAFTTSVKRMIANMAAQWVMSGIFGGGSGKPGLLQIGMTAASAYFAGSGGASASTVPATEAGVGWAGGAIAHLGGLMKKYHTGGLKSNELLAMLKTNEFVMRDSATRSIGVQNMEYMNRTGQIPQQQQAGPSVINHNYYVDAMDAQSFDIAMRTKGSRAIHDISLNSVARAKDRRDRRVSR